MAPNTYMVCVYVCVCVCVCVREVGTLLPQLQVVSALELALRHRKAVQ